MNTPENIWRGFAEIWTSDTYHVGMWPGAKLEVSPAGIDVSVPKSRIRFSADQIVESRVFRLPLPSLTIIFREGDRYSLVSFSNLRLSQLQQALESNQIPIQDRRVWRTGLEAGRDAKKYNLQTNSISKTG